MLINDSRILKNGDKVFKAPIIYSYLTNNNIYSNNMYMGISGTSIYNPINVYYKTPTGVLKETKTTDSSAHIFNFPTTNETSNKAYYFSGNVNGVYRLDFNNNTQYFYRGDIVTFINQFPRLETFNMYNASSNFNQSLTNVSFPRTLKWFSVRDTSLSGDITTIKGFENLERLQLYNGGYSGSLSNVGFTKLQYLELQYLYSLTGDVKEIVNNNPDLYYWYLWSNNAMTGDITDMDVSNLTTLYWYAASNENIIGSMSGWTFNDNMTQLSIYLRNFGGDISNWDLSNTKLTILQVQNYNYNLNSISGDLSTWILPATLQTFSLYGGTNVTRPPQDFSNCPNLYNVTFNYCNDMADDINNIDFGNMNGTIYFYQTAMYGNLELFTPPTGVTSLQLRYCEFTGNLSGISGTFSGVTNLYLDSNNLSGDVADMTIYNNWLALDVGYNSDVKFDLSGGFNTNNLNNLYLRSISGVTGDWSNFVIGKTSINQFILSNTPVYGDISGLEVEKISNFDASFCNIVSDVSSWFTGTSVTTALNIYSNTNLSGDTTNWNVNNITNLRLYSTKLSGTLKHNNVYQLQISGTQIDSDIANDFNFNSLYWFEAAGSNIQGNLSGVTLGYNFYYFSVTSCLSVSGTNEFISYLFVNRENWSRNGSYAYFSNIGDTASGSAEELGSLGSWAGSPWDLTEAGVNNLANGLDWDGGGSTTPWNSKQKVYFMKNRQISSTNPTLKYKLRNISY